MREKILNMEVWFQRSTFRGKNIWRCNLRTELSTKKQSIFIRNDIDKMTHDTLSPQDPEENSGNIMP